MVGVDLCGALQKFTISPGGDVLSRETGTFAGRPHGFELSELVEIVGSRARWFLGGNLNGVV